LLAPTHEEEITSLVSRTVKSYKELPLRLYQITRKYRDEFRPRHGLLRGREFVMKDLYTFDSSLDSALETYENVRAAYSRIFSELKLPVLAARASSGDMGGNLSHEYHLPAPIGDDRVIHCNSCDYIVNEEIAEPGAMSEVAADVPLGVWRGITRDRSTLVNVWYPKSTAQTDKCGPRQYSDADINLTAVKGIVPDLDTAVASAASLWYAAVKNSPRTATAVFNILDGRLPASLGDCIMGGRFGDLLWPNQIPVPEQQLPIVVHGGQPGEGPPNLLRTQTGDSCKRCSHGTLVVERAIELGHTFHLGTRYSDPLAAKITVPPSLDNISIQMGCHGIGISRIIAAAAELFSDDKGLNWPVSMAPFSCVLIPQYERDEEAALRVYEGIVGSMSVAGMSLDVVLDDRTKTLPWKLADADLVGFPVLVVLGREWRQSGRVEVQCRKLGMKDLVELEDLPTVIRRIYNDI